MQALCYENASIKWVEKNIQRQNVEFLAITFDKKKPVEQFFEDYEFNYAIAANSYDVNSIYGVNSFPTNMIIIPKGEIILKEIG